MKALFILLVLLPLCFGTVYNDKATFTADVVENGFADDFNSLSMGSEFFQYTSYSNGVGSVVKNSETRPSRFYVCGMGGNNFLQAYDQVQYDVIVFTFTGTGPKPTAFGANIFASNEDCSVNSGDITVTVDGVPTVLSASSTSQFFGFSNAAGISKIMISGSNVGQYFASIDNIWIGNLHCGDMALESNKGEECDGGSGCNAMCMCGSNFFATSPRSTDCDFCEAGSTCSGHGTCSTSAMTSVHCVCDSGYAGSNCGMCDTGFVGYPNCVPHCGDLLLEISFGEQCDGSANCDAMCMCNSGFANCDDNDANGCENLKTDPNNCNSCGHACSLPHVATYTCTNGVCGIATCETGYSNCDNKVANGCETDITKPTTCGSCDNNCLTKGHVSSASCSGKVCTVITCDNIGGTYSDCNKRGFDGCEINLDQNIDNCGTCRSQCVLNNANSTVCKSGACTLFSCKANFQSCDNVDSNGCEVDLNYVHTCGTCTNDCETKPNVVSATCANQICTVTSCAAGYSDCDGLAFNGCEINTDNSLSQCGTCGHACSLPHAFSKCVGGTCQVSKCTKGFCDTDGKATNGCEASC